MFTLIKIVLTSKKNCFKKFSFFIKLIKENIKSIDDFVDEILFQMQNLFVWNYNISIQNVIIFIFIDLIVNDNVIFN